MKNSAGRHTFIVLLAFVAFFPACTQEFHSVSRSSSVPAEPAPSEAPGQAESVPAFHETGVASWYGKDFQGRPTSSGEIFDMYGMSAAHRTLPLGTIIRVTNLDNTKSVTLKVNDRGPFVAGRALEVSLAAARELAFAASGTAQVKIEAIEEPHAADLYTVQAAVYAEEENAKLLKDRLSRKYEIITIVPFESNLGKFYRVRVGSYGTREKAELIAGKLKLEGLEPFVVRKDDVRRTGQGN